MKRKATLLALAVITLFGACNRGTSNAPYLEKETTNTVEADTTSTESLEYFTDSFTEQPLDLTNYSMDTVFATDDQPYFIWHQVAKSEHGYYYFKSQMLMFYDVNTKQEVPVCNKADCNHDRLNTDCNANFMGLSEMFPKDTISTNRILYYDGNLYMVGYDEESYTCLYKIASDGSTRERYMRLYRSDMYTSDGDTMSMSWSTPDVCIHHGYVYYIYNKESEQKIRRMKLGSEKAEIVFASSGVRPTLYRMQAYGDYLFFQCANFTDETYEKAYGGIYAYNIQTKETHLVKKDAISTYLIQGDTLYYEYNGNTEFHSLHLKTQEEQLLLDDIKNAFSMSVDAHYIYKFTEGGLLFVYDHKGNSVYTVNRAIQECHFGDGNYLIGEDFDFENQIAFTCILKVSDFANGQAEWTIFP